MNRRTAGTLLLFHILLAGLIFCCLVSAQEVAPAQRIYGTWYTTPLGNPATDPIRHEFRHNSDTGKDEMVVTRICQQGEYNSVIAKAVSPIEVSESTIRILKSATRTEGQGESECKASITAGSWGYLITSDGNRISVTDPGGVPDMFELARQDAAKNELLPSSIFGTWLLPTRYEHGATIQIKLIFYDAGSENHGKIREISTCEKANDKLQSQVDARVRISKGEITILDAASHDEVSGPMTCRATISAGALHYVLSPTGGTMVLSKPGAPSTTLTREQ